MATKRRSSKRTRGKAWDGRFREPTDPLVEAYSVSLSTDLEMAEQDIRGLSLIHI